jgi:thioredoxin 1
MAKNITAAVFDSEVLQNAKPVIVDFWAEWCGPCRAVAPILEELSAEYGDKIEIVKVNVDEEPSLAADYGIISIPTMQVFKGGQPVKQIIGAKPKATLVSELSEFLQ